MTPTELRRISHYLISGLVSGRRIAEMTKQRPLPSRVGVAVIVENLKALGVAR